MDGTHQNDLGSNKRKSTQKTVLGAFNVNGRPVQAIRKRETTSKSGKGKAESLPQPEQIRTTEKMVNALIKDWQSQLQAAESEIAEWENKKKPVEALKNTMKDVNDCIADLNRRIDEVDTADASESIQVVSSVKAYFTHLGAIANSGYRITNEWGKDMKSALKSIAACAERKKQAEKSIAYWTDKLNTVQAVAKLSEDQATIGEQEKQILSKFKDIQRKAAAKYEEISKHSTQKEYK